MRKVDPIEHWFAKQNPSVQALAISCGIPAFAVCLIVTFLLLLLILIGASQLFGAVGIVLFLLGFVYGAVYALIKLTN